MATTEGNEAHILVLAPVGRDAPLIREVLKGAGFTCTVCNHACELAGELSGGVDAVLLTEEALSTEVVRVLTEVVDAQPAWSDLPLVLLAGSNRRVATRPEATRAFTHDKNVTVLERPLRTRTLVTVMQAAVRARHRQYEAQRAEDTRRKRELERTLEEQLAEERRRLGRELHDGLRQQLSGIKMLSTNLYKELDAQASPHAALLQEFSQLVGDANAQVRRLISGLVPEKIEADALIPALARAAASIEQWYGLLCSVTCRQAIVLKDDETADHLFHIAQEAMTNAAKHAGASQIDVFLTVTDGTLTLKVQDDGAGLPDIYEKRGGTGLTNMRYRAELIGAGLDIRPGQPRGTVVTCLLEPGV